MDEGPVSPPMQSETVPLLIANNDALQRKSIGTSILSLTQPRAETRKTGTCYFCKKSFMKNKQVRLIFGCLNFFPTDIFPLEVSPTAITQHILTMLETTKALAQYCSRS